MTEYKIVAGIYDNYGIKEKTSFLGLKYWKRWYCSFTGPIEFSTVEKAKEYILDQERRQKEHKFREANPVAVLTQDKADE